MASPGPKEIEIECTPDGEIFIAWNFLDPTHISADR